MRLFLTFLFLFLVFSGTAAARPMITDLSERRIDIDAKFTGKEILIYGARVEAGDIVVVIRGPQDDYVVRKKEDIGGIWINTRSVEFDDAPQFYRIAASRDLDDIQASVLKDQLGIGFDTIEFNATPNSASTEINEFTRAFVRKMEEENLFDFEVQNLPLLEGILFRIRINFPEKIVRGVYTAEVYSFYDGELQGIQSVPINVDKVGLEALIYETAHDMPAIYGILAIIVAVSAGWAAASLFKRV